MILAWPLIAKAFTEDEAVFYNSPTESVVLVAATGAPEAPQKPRERVLGSNSTYAPSANTEAVQRQIEATFGVGHIMYWVALNESGLDPYAASGTGPEGVFQIAQRTWRSFECEGTHFDYRANIACAKKIYDKNGLQDWEWSRNEGFDGGWGKHL